MHVLNTTASINKAVSCPCACLYATHCWAEEECSAHNVTCKPPAPKGPSPINLKWWWVHWSALWLTPSGDSSSLFNGNSSVWAGKGGSRAEGWLLWVDHNAGMEPSTLTLRHQQDGPWVASTTLTLLMPRNPRWGLWAGGADFSHIAFVNNTAAAVGGSLGSQSASCRGLCPQLGSVWNRCAGFVSGPNKSLLQQMLLWLTGFHLRTYLFCQLCLQSLWNSSCLFSKQAVKYTLLYFLFHKKTRAEETCVNKPGGAPLAVGSQ